MELEQVHGEYKSVKTLREEGKKMKRIAFGRFKAADAMSELKQKGAVCKGYTVYSSVGGSIMGSYGYGLTVEGKAYVYEYEANCASALYVEQ